MVSWVQIRPHHRHRPRRPPLRSALKRLLGKWLHGDLIYVMHYCYIRHHGPCSIRTYDRHEHVCTPRVRDRGHAIRKQQQQQHVYACFFYYKIKCDGGCWSCLSRRYRLELYSTNQLALAEFEQAKQSQIRSPAVVLS
jgi:hypothetical protein